MDLVLSYFSKGVSCLILTLATFYMWSILLSKKLNFKSIRLYICALGVIFISLLNYYYSNAFIRMILLVIVFTIAVKCLFKENIKNSIITSIYSELILVISETIFALIITLVFNMGSVQIVENLFTSFLSNVFIALISLIIIKLKFVKKFYNFINSTTDKLNEKHLILMSLFIIIFVNILEATLYYDIDYRYLLVFNTLLIVFCFLIIIYSFKNKNNYMKVYDKYNTTVNSLKEYEDILDKYRISNHENENQLLTIRNMLPEKDKKAISYIDNLVKTNIKDNGEVMFDVSKIPAGGLRGLIYSKVLEMKELNIDYELEISNSVKTVDLINIDDLLMLDICKVIGVYLDNAIQAVQNLNEKYINIEMYLDENDLVISILNNYSGQIMIDKIEQKGYTSKGKGHGYGLTLAKKIIDNNKKLSNEKGISRDSFSQTLKIKL